MIKDNKVYDINGITLLEQIYEDFGDESIDMFLCDFPYTFKGKKRVTANAWDLPIDTKKFFDLAKKNVNTNRCNCINSNESIC